MAAVCVSSKAVAVRPATRVGKQMFSASAPT